MATPEHHFLFNRAQWSRGGTRNLWNNPMHRAPLEWDAHVALHEEVTIVPVPDRLTVQRVLDIYEPVQGDYIETIYRLADAIDVCSIGIKPNDRTLAELTMEALYGQIPFIKEGLAG
jgi:hypothetical protein